MSKYRLYPNKSSLKKKYSRYVQGGQTETNDIGIGWWERRLDIDVNTTDEIILTITTSVDRRPDIVSKIYYGRKDLDWFILQYNNIVDINEEFVTGRTIRIPSKSRVLLNLLTKKVK